MGVRYREYLSERSSTRPSAAPNINVTWEGIDELLNDFKAMENAFEKADRAVRRHSKYVLNRYYLPAVRRLADNPNMIDDDGKMSRSFGIIQNKRRRGKSRLYGVLAGPRVYGKYRAEPNRPNSPWAKRRYNYESGGWLAHFFEHGTKDRDYKTKWFKSNHVGRIKAYKFQERAWDGTKRIMEKVLMERLRDSIERSVKSHKKSIKK